MNFVATERPKDTKSRPNLKHDTATLVEKPAGVLPPVAGRCLSWHSFCAVSTKPVHLLSWWHKEPHCCAASCLLPVRILLLNVLPPTASYSSKQLNLCVSSEVSACKHGTAISSYVRMPSAGLLCSSSAHMDVRHVGEPSICNICCEFSCGTTGMDEPVLRMVASLCITCNMTCKTGNTWPFKQFGPTRT